tara:strand:- start:672 stop:860 length:189 start_codon:yes stop_codon:yes gene_type:complete
MNTTLHKLSKIFDKEHFALVVASQQAYSKETDLPKERKLIIGVVSRVDLLNFIISDRYQDSK